MDTFHNINPMNFSRSQRNGLIVLFLMVLILFLLQKFYVFEKQDVNPSFEAFETEIDRFYKKEVDDLKPKHQTLNPVNFDPNRCTQETMLQMGLTAKQIQQILNYRTKGGVFKIKSDLSKIYALDKATYQKLKPYILLPETRPKVIKQTASTKQKPLEKSIEKTVYININKADSAELQTVKGIGAVLSKRIIRYRDLLGGFYQIEQLSEVYGIKEESYQKIKPQVFTDSLIQFIDVNFASAGELSKHPYISAKQAKKIVIERSFNGAYKNMVELIERNNINEKKFKKVKPYLRF